MIAHLDSAFDQPSGIQTGKDEGLGMRGRHYVAQLRYLVGNMMP